MQNDMMTSVAAFPQTLERAAETVYNLRNAHALDSFAEYLDAVRRDGGNPMRDLVNWTDEVLEGERRLEEADQAAITVLNQVAHAAVDIFNC
jgi:hypothetical protein